MAEVSLKELSDAATQGAWTYPDWGTDFRTGKTTIGITSPAFEGNGRANRAFIVALVNAYRAGRLHDDAALAEAAARGMRAGIERAVEMLADLRFESLPEAAAKTNRIYRDLLALATAAPAETEERS